jgi:hypothetical protein
MLGLLGLSESRVRPPTYSKRFGAHKKPSNFCFSNEHQKTDSVSVSWQTDWIKRCTFDSQI